MKFTTVLIFLSALMTIISCSDKTTVKSQKVENDQLKALIIDGQNNHGVFPMTTVMMKDYLEETGLFEVDIERTKYIYQGPHHNEIEGVDSIQQLVDMYPIESEKEFEHTSKPQSDSDYHPNFSKYDVVICNFGWQTADWPKQTQDDFVKYMKSGGGLVIIHAANNAFGDWDEYNKMIGLGGWGGRDENSGPYVYYDDNDELQRDMSEGNAGSHGPQHEFVLTTRSPDHPIMKDLPEKWLHTKDELYERLRGPAENMTVLATAFSDKEGNQAPWDKTRKGSGNHEPMLMTIEYGEGRVFHTALGHMDYSMESVGFIITFQRGAEWAATGKVTIDVPDDFPTVEQSSARAWRK
ncbi:ThuA domain-containing protein [Portibacter marinus]|uniref:ThuA domain-containing protein n=1 Tax=Portibacter marinus TaxID=2898660 RepID=UPI001F24F5FB|nr:ThuA domain-containing protein [Portibacter marinus]